MPAVTPPRDSATQPMVRPGRPKSPQSRTRNKTNISGTRPLLPFGGSGQASTCSSVYPGVHSAWGTSMQISQFLSAEFPAHGGPTWLRAVVISIFAVPALVAIAEAILISYSYFFSAPQPDDRALYFSRGQVSQLGEVAKTLIPTVTGFAVLVGSGLGLIHKTDRSRLVVVQAGILLVCITLVASLGFWVFALGVSVDCNYPFDREPPYLPSTDPLGTKLLNTRWAGGVFAEKLGTISFFLSIDFAVLVAMGLFSEVLRPSSSGPVDEPATT